MNGKPLDSTVEGFFMVIVHGNLSKAYHGGEGLVTVSLLKRQGRIW